MHSSLRGHLLAPETTTNLFHKILSPSPLLKQQRQQQQTWTSMQALEWVRQRTDFFLQRKEIYK